jgi:hypothetical protein
MRDLLDKLKKLDEGFMPKEIDGEVEDFEFTGDDGEPGFGTLYYKAQIKQSDEHGYYAEVDPTSLRGECEGDGNNKLDDELATAVVQSDGPDHEAAMDAAFEDAMDQIKNADIDVPQESIDDSDEQTFEGEEFYEYYGFLPWHEDVPVDEAEYRGRKVPLGKPMRGDVKKFKVYVRDPKTKNVKKVNFGDPNMKIKRSNPKRRKSFRARHNCDNPGPRTKARYWSCRKW